MTNEEFLARWDARLAIDRELLARGNELMDENRKAFAEIIAESRRASEENRKAYAEITAEHRRASEENSRAFAVLHQDMQDVRVEQRQMTMRGERVADGFIAVLKDLHEESVAQRQALLRMLDGLGGNGPAAAGA
jgi:hypothetical protein